MTASLAMIQLDDARIELNDARREIARLKAALPLLKEIMDLHSKPDTFEYSKCDTEPCNWCCKARKILEEHTCQTPTLHD